MKRIFGPKLLGVRPVVFAGTQGHAFERRPIMDRVDSRTIDAPALEDRAEVFCDDDHGVA